ncbi:glutathione S-transferase family protein [Ruegeria sp. WL0004]|uniref:Glutathione S-transferase family protein n=1 Tax=Ruegeria marisflavi TaxID=2984152 RepID=A0ABT2WS07_9RHOB|nr:glutathione S-transferase family protein [Ruegeria sp. WL0004]MCU9838636.1 glutathione S-transferase family protein [Ruegeria sp. WL0004]
MTLPRPVLTGYSHSIYTRIIRLILLEKGISFDYVEHDPFAQDALGPHPFGRVPFLCHGDFAIYETAAISAYLDAAFDGTPMMPDSPQAAARAIQVVCVADAYAYWPLVRQIYEHAVFRPTYCEPSDPTEVQDGLRRTPKVLAALDEIAREGLVLSQGFGRAECHLAPMIAALVQAPEGADLLARYPDLYEWWQRTALRPSMRETETSLPSGDVQS